MRIEKVSIYNINSLSGRFEIDFTDGKYSEGLFAITGPSGSGKTTVLDSVCLALYGKTPRIGSVSETQDEIMSKNKEECSATVFFTSRSRKYKAYFSHRRGKGEKPFRPVKREIYEIADGKESIIASTITESERKIPEITGLTYSQFTRSIMLAQFQFAKFLESDSNERAAILEQVSDMGIYREISASVYERTKHERERLDEIKSRMQSLPVMDESQIKELQYEKESLTASIASHNRLKDAFFSCRESGLKLKKLNREHEDYNKNSAVLSSNLTIQAELYKKSEKDESEAKRVLSDLQKTLKAVRELDKRIAIQDVTVGKLGRDIADYEEKINGYKRNILKIFKNYLPAASAEELKNLYESPDPGDYLRKGVKEKLDAVNSDEQSLREASKMALGGKDEAFWQKRLDTLKIVLPIAEAQAEIEKSGKLLEVKNEEQKKLLLEEDSIRTEEKAVEEKLVYARLEEKFGEERRKLEDGKPCPLCGAAHHPLADKPHDSAFLAETLRENENIQKRSALNRQQLADSRKLIYDLKETISNKTVFIENKIGEAKKSGIDAEEALKENDPEKLLAGLSQTESIMRGYFVYLTKLNALAKEAVELTSRLAEIDRDVAEVIAGKRSVNETAHEAEKKKASKDGELIIREKFLAERRKLFGDKNADEEEKKTTDRSDESQRIKEERRKLADKAERDFEQNKKDITRTAESIHTEAKAFGETYTKTRTEALSLQSPASQSAEINFLFNGLKGAVSALGENAPQDFEIFGGIIGSLDSLSSAENQRQGELNQIIRENDTNKANLICLKKDETKQSGVCAKWDRLNALIGSAEGDKFSRMAQGYTFEALLRYANACLKRMTDRYILVRDTSNGAKPLELCVADNYQAGDTRPASNLSGGESFIVSMALALGMSEMSSGKTRIDSLFIDEGFASLDEDYLEAALQTLSSLGNREGKLVGVISHVGALKERIDAQIEVKKLSGGRSTLSGPGVTVAGE